MFELKIDHTQEEMTQAFGISKELHEEIRRSITELYQDSDDWLKLTEAFLNKFKDKLNETQMVYAMMKLGEFMHLGFLLEALHKVKKAQG